MKLQQPLTDCRIADGFRDLRWMSTLPEHLDVPKTQFLLIGESSGLEKAMEIADEDKGSGKAGPMDELETLEHEDTERMEQLGKDDSAAIFADLQVHVKDYPKLQTTF